MFLEETQLFCIDLASKNEVEPHCGMLLELLRVQNKASSFARSHQAFNGDKPHCGGEANSPRVNPLVPA